MSIQYAPLLSSGFVPNAPATISNIPSLVNELAFGQYSVISSNSIRPTSRTANAGFTTATWGTRLQCVVPLACTNGIQGVRLVFANWYTGGVGETPNTNGIYVRASIQPYNLSSVNEASGDIIYGHVKFNGRELGYIPQGQTLISDPFFFGAAPGTYFWVKSWQSSGVGAAPGSGPTLTVNAAAGQLTAGTYLVCYTNVFADGSESLPSPTASATVSTAGQIQVTAPTLASDAIGYNCYVTTVGGSTPQYESSAGFTQAGQNANINFTIITSTTSNAVGLKSVNAGDSAYTVQGGVINGGTGPGSCNTGEYTFHGIDLTTSAYTPNGAGVAQQISGPIAILGLTPYAIAKSVAKVGDSIAADTADFGYAGSGVHGGYITRIAQQQFAKAYNPYTSTAGTPGVVYAGYVDVAQGGETGITFASIAGMRRTQIAALATNIFEEYGRNDLGASSNTAAQLAATLVTIGTRFVNMQRMVQRCTMVPWTNTSDGFATLANQYIAAGNVPGEGYRRCTNNWILGKSNSQSVVGDVPYIANSGGNRSSSYNFYGTADGVATLFIANNIFVSSTLQVFVNGVLKTLTTDYTITTQATINGVTYGSGVTFVAAPTNGTQPTFDYTSAPSYQGFLGTTYTKIFDASAAIETNGSGTPGTNGGFVLLATAPSVGPKSLTSVTAGTLTDSSQTWTQDQWRGYYVYIVTDTVTPTAVGQFVGIATNTPTVLTLGANFGVTPSSSATYQIYDVYFNSDGTHPSTLAHQTIAASYNVTNLV